MYKPKFSTLLISLMLLFQSAPALCMTRARIPVATARQYTASALRHRQRTLNPRMQPLRMSRRNMDPGKIIIAAPGTIAGVGTFLTGLVAAVGDWLYGAADEEEAEFKRLVQLEKELSQEEDAKLKRFTRLEQERIAEDTKRLKTLPLPADYEQLPGFTHSGVAKQPIVYAEPGAVQQQVGHGLRGDQHLDRGAGAGGGAGAAGDRKQEYKQVVADPDAETAADTATAGGLGFTTPWSAQQKKDIERARADLQAIYKKYGELGDIAKNPYVPQYIKDAINSAAMQHVVDYFKQKEARSSRGKAQQRLRAAGAAGGGAPKGPDDDDDEPDEDDEFEYEASPKHHDNAKPDVSPAPLFPHESLRRSIKVGSKRRAALCRSGKWVDIFELTLRASGRRKAIYHGYRVLLEAIEEIPKVATALRDLGLIR